METLYPIFYGTRLVTWDVLEATFKPYCHPEVWRRVENFLKHQGGKFGIGGGRRLHGSQPNKPGFAGEGDSFHQDQDFPSGRFYSAFDFVVVNPGFVHRAPLWNEVPKQGTQPAFDYGVHMNVSTESWHGQGVPIDGMASWRNAGRPDLQYNYPIKLTPPRPQPPQPPVPPTQPPSQEIIVQIKSRVLKEGSVGNDVKYFQRILNDISGQGLLLDGHYGARTTESVKNWQRFMTAIGVPMTVDGELGPITQASMIEMSMAV